MEKNIVRSIRVNELLNDMMKADKKLYEQILDTPGFAYAFNELCKKAQEERIVVTPTTPQSDFKKFTLLDESQQTIALPYTQLSGEHEDKGQTAEEILMKHLPKGCYWEEMGNLTNTPKEYVLEAMTEYSSLKEQQTHNRAVQECIDLFPRIKDSWIRSELEKMKK